MRAHRSHAYGGWKNPERRASSSSLREFGPIRGCGPRPYPSSARSEGCGPRPTRVGGAMCLLSAAAAPNLSAHRVRAEGGRAPEQITMKGEVVMRKLVALIALASPLAF